MRYSLLLTILLFGIQDVFSQDHSVKLDYVPVKQHLLTVPNPLLEGPDTEIKPELNSEPSQFDNEILARISDIYRMQVLAIDAQVQQDLVQAESHITNSLSAIQALMDDYPEIQNSRRFSELYRSVMTEYREFYGISESEQSVEGEIYTIRNELIEENDDWIVEGFSLPDDFSLNKTDVPLVLNKHVHRHLMYYTMRRPDVMERWLERSKTYFPMMKEIFEDEKVPLELIHLSMIESGLTPTARSWASAVGLWQFIRGTGAMYGLEVNWWIDERRDPIKSTRAAAQHLRDLYEIWDDWHLAMANYNISPRGLRRAIRAAGGVEDYWVAYPYLPRETRGYVPGFIAATMIAMNPEEFGFHGTYEGDPYEFDIVEVDGLMPLESLAKAAGLTLSEIKEYNPELLRWATPPGNSYPLKIPRGIKDSFIAAYNELPKEEKAQEIAMHVVRSGETLGYIARRYGTSVRALYSSNDGLKSMIHPGQRIVVPVAPGSMEQIASDRPSNQSRGRSTNSSSRSNQVQAPPNTSPVAYTVKSGDTIGHIAEWYDVRAWQIRAWNRIGNTIRVGQRLTIHVPGSRSGYFQQVEDLSFAQKQEIERRQRRGENIYALNFNGSNNSNGNTINYTVKRNETLGGIARRHNVSVAQLQQWNNINGSRIYVGQSLIIRK